ncbi:MAG: slyA 5 [Firmicutes bacterium]|nr:slyA 5 [Bacillota bacterium]
MEKTDELFRQLYQTTRVISKGLNQMLQKHGIYSSEWTIITTIKDKGEMPQAVLANYLNIEPAAISKSLINLERKGFIWRREGTDKREKTVFLTEASLQLYPQWEEVARWHRQQLLIGLSEEKLNETYELLQAIFTNAQHVK